MSLSAIPSRLASLTGARHANGATCSDSGEARTRSERNSTVTCGQRWRSLKECVCVRITTRWRWPDADRRWGSRGRGGRGRGMMVAGGAAAPAARAATLVPGTALAAKPASAPTGVRSHYAELANAATGANLWSRSSVLERPMGSVTKVMTAYVVLTTPGLNLNRVITVPERHRRVRQEVRRVDRRAGPRREAHHAAAALRDDAAVRLRRRLHARQRVRSRAFRFHREDERHGEAARAEPRRTSPTSAGCRRRARSPPTPPRTTW